MAGIQDAIKQAQGAAAAIAEQEHASTAVIEASVNHAGQVQTFQKPSMGSVAAATSVIPKMTPFLKVNEFGILLGKKDKNFKTSFKAKVLLLEDKGFQLKWTLRFGNPAQYYSTYDGVSCDKGGSWHDALGKARMIAPGAEPYVSVDVPLTLAEAIEVTGEGGKLEKIPAGTVIAFNASKTNFDEWAEFWRSAEAAGVVGQEVEIICGHRDIHHNGNDWGVVTFTLA